MNEPTSEAQLKALVAREHGLDREAADLLTGETLEELETSASALAKLIGDRGEQEPEPAPEQDFITAAATAKAERKRALLNVLTGRAPQPRDERGRFTGFDGGARKQSISRPPESHDQWLGRLLSERRADVGRGL